jgi:probable rRNA maturation factor
MQANVDLQNESGLDEIPELAQFERWVEASLRSSYDGIEQAICIVDEARGREMNQRYRDRDYATNVLAFPADSSMLDYDCLGDLVICAPVVLAEAREQGKSADAHWAHLVVHGMLHLQGYDHESDAQAATMEAVEVEILDTLGYTNPYNDDATDLNEGGNG